MSDRFQTEPPGGPAPAIPEHHAPLPPWIAARVLRPGEMVTWVRGPRFNPAWERYATHPLLFVAALAVGLAWVVAGGVIVGPDSQWFALPVLAAGAVVLASIFVLGICSGYFTRLVVTNLRVVIVQGYEVCRSWGTDRLPRSLVRHRISADGERSPTIDLDAVKNLFGDAAGQFTDAKTILAFGKQLTQIKAREDGRR